MKTWRPLPDNVYSFVEATPGTVLLETSRPGPDGTSRIFANPLSVLEARTPADVADLFLTIDKAVQRGHFAAGYFAYECGQCFEPNAGLRPGRDHQLLAWMGIYENCRSFDHSTGTFLDSGPGAFAAEPPASGMAAPAVSFGLDEREYSSRIAEIHRWIGDGDAYQLNLTFPVYLETAEEPASLYARLVSAQPVEFGAFLHCGERQHILCFSPELFFRLEDCGGKRRITAQPMKGTARRGRTTMEDRAIAAELGADQKNRAENVMIVDLIRNDLGRICAFGSVRVDHLFDVKRYSTLWQMTSTVCGDLRPEVGYGEIFRALFPCGSITGAPKVRAMQLLAQIEEEPRGVYTGAIGFFSREQTVFNVAIRTLVLENGKAAMGVGGGIVIDSRAEAEFRECKLKAEFLIRSAETFSLIETMLWEGVFPLLELHLDRLSDSAEFFGFRCDREAIRSTLIGEAGRFSDQCARRVRLLLDASGAVRIEPGILTRTPGREEGFARVCMTTHPTDPNDRFLFHKTTNRRVYDHAFASATNAGFADALFLNTRGEVTEGAISNVFIEKAGRWYTPPIDCGVLPGVYRRHLLETRPDIEEKILSPADVQGADAVYICNAVRGLLWAHVSFDTVIE